MEVAPHGGWSGRRAAPPGPHPARAAAGGPPFDRLLLAFSIVLLAFNDLAIPLPLGELSQDAFVLVVPLLLLLVLRFPGGILVPTSLRHFAAAFGLVVLCSVAFNYQEISAAAFKNRSGFGRVLSQGLTFGLGITIAVLFANFTRRGMISSIVRGARAALLVMAGVGVLELASWHSLPVLTQLHQAAAVLIHSNSGADYAERLRTTAFEVSWAGVMLSFFFPFAILELEGRERRVLFYTLLVLALALVAQSRTSLLVVALQTAIVLWYYSRRRADIFVYGLTVAALAGLLLIGTTASLRHQAADTLSNMVEYGSFAPADQVAEENVSNISRGASIKAGLAMFKERPLFGVGFGQFGFHYADHVESGDLRSYEVRNWLADAHPGWPPGFSIHTRLLAETGVVGYLLWLALILALLFRSLRAAVGDSTAPGLRTAHLAVAMTLGGLLLVGASIDSFRFFGGWIAIGVGLSLRADSRPWSPGASGH